MQRKAAASAPEDWWTVRQSGGYLHLSTSTVWRMIREKKLRMFKVRTRTLLRASDVRALVKEASGDLQ